MQEGGGGGGETETSLSSITTHHPLHMDSHNSSHTAESTISSATQEDGEVTNGTPPLLQIICLDDSSHVSSVQLHVVSTDNILCSAW